MNHGVYFPLSFNDKFIVIIVRDVYHSCNGTFDISTVVYAECRANVGLLWLYCPVKIDTLQQKKP